MIEMIIATRPSIVLVAVEVGGFIGFILSIYVIAQAIKILRHRREIS